MLKYQRTLVIVVKLIGSRIAFVWNSKKENGAIF